MSVWIIACCFAGGKFRVEIPTVYPEESKGDDSITGRALRAAAIEEDSGVYGHGGADAGAGDRRECGDLYAGERGHDAESAGGRSEDAGAHRRPKPVLRGRWITGR